MSGGFVTIGHSNRSLETFLSMLRGAEVSMLVDVRSFPKSRSNPVFNTDRLPESLGEAGIDYRHLSALGGRRPRQDDVDARVNAYWRVGSFHNYADYAMGARFGTAFDELVGLGRVRVVAIMCAEAVWWRCHRRIIADYLLARGFEVKHLMGEGRIAPARMTPSARVTQEGQVVYPAG